VFRKRQSIVAAFKTNPAFRKFRAVPENLEGAWSDIQTMSKCRWLYLVDGTVVIPRKSSIIKYIPSLSLAGGGDRRGHLRLRHCRPGRKRDPSSENFSGQTQTRTKLHGLPSRFFPTKQRLFDLVSDFVAARYSYCLSSRKRRLNNAGDIFRVFAIVRIDSPAAIRSRTAAISIG
jgi:hypothetical protein